MSIREPHGISARQNRLNKLGSECPCYLASAVVSGYSVPMKSATTRNKTPQFDKINERGAVALNRFVLIDIKNESMYY